MASLKGTAGTVGIKGPCLWPCFWTHPISRLLSVLRYLKAGAQSQPPACEVAHLHGIFLFEVAGELQDQCTEVSVAAWISRAGGGKCPGPHYVRALVSSESTPLASHL